MWLDYGKNLYEIGSDLSFEINAVFGMLLKKLLIWN